MRQINSKQLGWMRAKGFLLTSYSENTIQSKQVKLHTR